MPRRRLDSLIGWYRAGARDLPWRRTNDPWPILVSEVMLQQTQAARVAPVFERFMARYPTPAALADTPLGEVLEAWQGLGYPVRARRLRAAAALIRQDGWPSGREGLEALPGVGPYTSAAVASFALDIPAAVADTNTKRVLSRWGGEPLDGSRLADQAARLLPEDHATWNQALMELGATVCRPRPRCEDCPVARWCADPTVYQPPPGQERYEGSIREVRGDVLRALADGALPMSDLAAAAGHEDSRVQAAVEGLERDGLVERGATVELAG